MPFTPILDRGSVERPLRIGFLTTEYPTQEYSGGIGSYVRQIAYSVADLGHAAVVLLYGAGGKRVWDGPVQVHSVHESAFASSLPRPLGKRSGLLFAAQLAKLADDLGLDIVEAPEFGGLTSFLDLFKSPNLQVVVRLHTCTNICRSLDRSPGGGIRGKLRNILQDYLEKRAIDTADLVTAYCKPVVDQTRTALGITREDIFVIPGPVSDLFFSSRSDRLAPNKKMVLFAGRLEWRKGPDLLVKCLPTLFRRHPDVVCCLAGADTHTGPDGTSMLSYLSSLIPEEIRERVEFAGFLRPEQLLQKYREAAVCAFPQRDGLGLAVAEAMACGKATVMIDAPGVRDVIVDGETGLVAKTEDPESLACALDRLLRDSSLQDTLGSAARDTALARFHSRKLTESLIGIYRKRMSFARAISPP